MKIIKDTLMKNCVAIEYESDLKMQKKVGLVLNARVVSLMQHLMQGDHWRNWGTYLIALYY